ncbi:Gluconokinase [Minicystis rosea]|nr:Gluconokinase [Minicystis rosea]
MGLAACPGPALISMGPQAAPNPAPDEPALSTLGPQAAPNSALTDPALIEDR